MKRKFKLWWKRVIGNVIPIEEADQLGLTPIKNIYGDMINVLGCRSIWEDEKGNQYRVDKLYDYKD